MTTYSVIIGSPPPWNPWHRRRTRDCTFAASVVPWWLSVGLFWVATDQAKAFVLALRNGNSPIVITDSQTALQDEFAIAEDGPTFTVTGPQ